MRAFPLVAIALLALAAGCATTPETPDGCQGSDASCVQPSGLVKVEDRHNEAFNVSGYYSRTLAPGLYGIEDGKAFDVKVTLPPTSGADAAAGMVVSSLGLFLPKIPGCDWSATSLPAQCHIPVIADAGPYYAASTGQADLQTEGDSIATQPAHRLGGFLIENFVPHGYAVAQVSVLGTGDSSFCQDLMGLNEQAALDATVTWLGTQAWSNGNVSLIGRSYDGSTPWEAATFGNPHLKTIVPISGLTGQYELLWRNGSAETRGPGVLYALYAAMTIDGDANDPREVLCPNYLLGAPEGGLSFLTGGNNAAGPNQYWAERYFLDRAVANYKGSIYAIHGLQDWNVENHMILPYYQMLQEKGFEVKGLFGQWNHMYPDRPSEHVSTPSGEGHEAYPATVRYDWAQDLLEWFDHYLKGTGPRPDLHVEVQDNHGNWRIESSYPARDVAWTALRLGNASVTLGGSGPAAPMPAVDAAHTVTLDFPALASETRISGIARLPLTVTPTTSGGQVYAQLNDVAPDGAALRLGHAIMDLRYAAGGKSPAPVVPGLPMKAHMEFEALEALVPAGHHLQLVMADTGRDYLPTPTQGSVLLDLAGSTLLLPELPVQHGIGFLPPQWSGKADATAPQP